MSRKVAITSSLVPIGAIAVLLLGCPALWSGVDHMNLGWNSMDHLPIQRSFGLRVIGGIGGDGFELRF